MCLQYVIEWLDIAELKGYLYEKKSNSRGYCSISRRFGKYGDRGNWKNVSRRQKATIAIGHRSMLERAAKRMTMCFVPHLYAPFNYFKTRRWKNVCYVATVRSDLFYWDVGTSVQFTKCPVEHGGPVIVSMIRTSFRAPIRHIREL